MWLLPNPNTQLVKIGDPRRYIKYSKYGSQRVWFTMINPRNEWFKLSAMAVDLRYEYSTPRGIYQGVFRALRMVCFNDRHMLSLILTTREVYLKSPRHGGMEIQWGKASCKDVLCLNQTKKKLTRDINFSQHPLKCCLTSHQMLLAGYFK